MEQQLLDIGGYTEVRQLEEGDWVGILPLIFTTSVCCGIDLYSPFKYRWCFEDKKEAMLFYNSMVEFDEIPVHRTSLKGHRFTTKPLLELDD